MSWEDFYDAHFADRVLDAFPDEAEAQADALLPLLGLGPGDRVLDQCCGTGRLAVPLAARGLAVEGVDRVPGYLARAAAAAEARGVRLALHAADAADFRPAAPVRAVVNWHTSFGHALDDAANLALLRAAFDALAPGGALALDFPNATGLLRALQPVFVQERAPWRVERFTALDVARGVLHQRWVWRGPEGRVEERGSALRLYTPWELVGLAEAAGFTGCRLLAGPEGAPMGVDEPRCLLLAARP